MDCLRYPCLSNGDWKISNAYRAYLKQVQMRKLKEVSPHTHTHNLSHTQTRRLSLLFSAKRLSCAYSSSLILASLFLISFYCDSCPFLTVFLFNFLCSSYSFLYYTQAHLNLPRTAITTKLYMELEMQWGMSLFTVILKENEQRKKEGVISLPPKHPIFCAYYFDSRLMVLYWKYTLSCFFFLE